MLKYIVISIEEVETPIVFSSNLKHDDVAFKFDSFKFVSAGFINTKWQCSGKSIGLKIESRGQVDSELIKFWQDMFA